MNKIILKDTSVIILFINILITSVTPAPKPGFINLADLLRVPENQIGEVIEDVSFLHYMRNETIDDVIEHTDVTKEFDTIDSSLPVVIIFHGFMGSPHGKSTTLLINGYVKKGGNNVIGVNYEDHAKGPWYGLAVQRSQQAAQQVANWMNQLVLANLTSWQNIQLVGFSLGAQVAGLTAKYTPSGSRVGKIIALDPARPLFDEKNMVDQLNPDDADFTVVVHTCGSFLAIPSPRGHVDIYPNGGEHPQPPCTENNLNDLLRRTIDSPGAGIPNSERRTTKIFAGLVCSHYMALALWVESLTGKTKFTAKQCSSWKGLRENECNESRNSTAEIDMNDEIPTSARGVYYFKTDEHVPYIESLNDLIADGIQEYAKVRKEDHTDKKEGHGEVKDVTPAINSANADDERNNQINRIDTYSSSNNLVLNVLLLIFVLFVPSLLNIK